MLTPLQQNLWVKSKALKWKILEVLPLRIIVLLMTPAKLKPAGGTLKQVKDVVNKNAGKADPMQKLKGAIAQSEEEEMDAEATLEETPTVTDEVVEEDAVVEAETVEENSCRV
jgi:hypothetical protein